MTIVLYGIPAEIAGRIAERYALKSIYSLEEIGSAGSLLLVPPMASPRRLLEFYNAMMAHEDDIDAVIVCGLEACDAASTVQYCSPQGKFFSISGDAGEEEMEYELTRIIETHLGLICAHEGI